MDLILLAIIAGMLWLVFRPHSCKRDGHKFTIEEALSAPESDFAICAKCGQTVNIMEQQ